MISKYGIRCNTFCLKNLVNANTEMSLWYQYFVSVTSLASQTNTAMYLLTSFTTVQFKWFFLVFYQPTASVVAFFVQKHCCTSIICNCEIPTKFIKGGTCSWLPCCTGHESLHCFHLTLCPIKMEELVERTALYLPWSGQTLLLIVIFDHWKQFVSNHFVEIVCSDNNEVS